MVPRTKWLGLVWVAACAWGCTSRTVPLPPPAIDSVASQGNDTVTVSGVALSGAFVGVINEDRDTGVIVVAGDDSCERCPFEARVAGAPGDTLRIWQFFDTSSASFHTVPAP